MLRPTLLATGLAAVYLIWGPSSQDLAAATFRADLFADHGFAIWNNAWYSGHYLLSYSVLYPPLGALLGPQLTGALAVIVAAALFAVLARRRFGAAALVPSLWFAAAVGELAADRQDPVPARAPVRPRGAARRGRRATGGRGRARGVDQPREPGRRPVRDPRRGRPDAHCADPRGDLAGARRAPPDLDSQPRLSHRGLRAVRVLGLHRDPAAGGARALAGAARVRGPARRHGALRGARPRPVHDRQPAGRQHHPPRGPVRRPGAGAGAVAARSLDRDRGRDPARLLAAGGSRPRSRQGRRRRLDRARLLPAAALRARRASTAAGALSGPRAADQEPLGGRLRRPRAAARPRLAAPARVRGLRPVHRGSAHRRRPIARGSTSTPSASSPCPTRRATTSPRTRSR